MAVPLGLRVNTRRDAGSDGLVGGVSSLLESGQLSPERFDLLFIAFLGAAGFGFRGFVSASGCRRLSTSMSVLVDLIFSHNAP